MHGVHLVNGSTEHALGYDNVQLARQGHNDVTTPKSHPLIKNNHYYLKSGEVHSCTVVNHHLDYVDITFEGSPTETSHTILQST